MQSLTTDVLKCSNFVYKNELAELNNLVKEIINCNPLPLETSASLKTLHQISRAMEEDFLTVVVLGEFKRGKSTFINALLGKNILPADVTPTTATINALIWNETENMEIHLKNGQIVKRDLTRDNLSKFNAECDCDFSDVNYIKIHLCSDLLKNRVVIIDTPGVDDINCQRVEVTYNFIPRADCVIFLLDATTPLKKTEKEFIDDFLLKNKIDNILFVVNFTDRLSEEENLEVLEFTRKRLKAVTKMNEINIVACSALKALEGKLKENKTQIVESGFCNVEKVLDNFLTNSGKVENRIKNYKNRALFVATTYQNELKNSIKLKSQSITELEEQLKNVRKIFEEREVPKKAISIYGNAQLVEMKSLVLKSLLYFRDELKDEVSVSLEAYNGTDFKSLMENVITMQLRRGIKSWLQRYYSSMEHMVSMMEKEITLAMIRFFKLNGLTLNLPIDEISINGSNYVKNFSFNVQDLSNVNIHAGIIVGLASVVAGVLTGGILGPVIALAGMPLVRNTLAEGKILEAKEKIRPQLLNSINITFQNLEIEIFEWLSRRTATIVEYSEKQFEYLLRDIQVTILNEIKTREQDIKDENDTVEKINKDIDYISDIISRIERKGEQ